MSSSSPSSSLSLAVTSLTHYNFPPLVQVRLQLSRLQLLLHLMRPHPIIINIIIFIYFLKTIDKVLEDLVSGQALVEVKANTLIQKVVFCQEKLGISISAETSIAENVNQISKKKEQLKDVRLTK